MAATEKVIWAVSYPSLANFAQTAALAGATAVAKV